VRIFEFNFLTWLVFTERTCFITVAHQCQSAVFKRFVPGKPVTVKVPVQFLNANSCPGAKKGGYEFLQI
jgi:hypothetical protein